MSEIRFKRDTAFRKQFFVPDSFAHPAKMDAQLLIWIVENYTQAGETILDPMAGSGTMMLACTLGRNCVLVELEEKFCKMMADNWEEVRMRPQLGSQMGDCQIMQGDSRQLEGLMVDKCVFSPPFADSEHNYKHGLKVLGKNFRGRKAWEDKGLVDKIVTSPPYADRVGAQDYNWLEKHKRELKARSAFGDFGASLKNKYPDSPNNIANLPYGQIDKIVTSPPYEGSDISQTHMTSNKRGDPSDPNYRPSWKRKLSEGYAGTKRPYADSIITSPPYENAVHKGSGEWSESPAGRLIGGKQSNGGKMLGVPQGADYINSQGNIGNLKGDTYLEAMLQVYQSCYRILKPQGLMILVTKNFIRNKQIVGLDEDTIKLCEQAGFNFVERHYRKLPAQSFWRIIYHQKYPDVKPINYEDVLVFRK